MYVDTTFFSLNRQADWEKGALHNLVFTERGVRIQRSERYGFYHTIRLDRIEGLDRVADFALGENDKIYLLDRSSNVFLYDYENHYADLIFRAGHSLFSPQAKLTRVGSHLLIAESEGINRLVAYSPGTGQAVWRMNRYSGIPVHPLAITTDRNGDAYVLLPLDPVRREGVVQAADNSFYGVLKVNSGGQPLHLYQHHTLMIKKASRLHNLQERFHITVGPDGKLFILDSKEREVTSFHADGKYEKCSRIQMYGGSPSGIGVDPHGALYVGDNHPIEQAWEDNRFILQFNEDGGYVDEVTGFRGQAMKLLAGYARKMYVWNEDENLITVLEQKRRTQPLGRQGALKGVYFSHAFDSTETETVWHKITVDSELPNETQLRISYYASDQTELIVGGRRVQLDDYLQDEHIPLAEKLPVLDQLYSVPIVNPKDALLRAKGRYIWFKVEWSGNDRKSPLMKKLRVYFPRNSYLDYLPGVYQQDSGSRDFLERYLSLFGTFFDEIEETIDHMSRFFDVDSSSGDLLKWLATWLGIAVDERWSEEQIRRLMKKSPELFKKRGTRQGLEEMIEVFTGEKPFIVEYFQYKYLLEKAQVKEYMEQLYGLDPYRFCVLIKPEVVKSEEERKILQKIIDEEKPAFSEAQLVVLEPRIYLGTHSYLGINTFLSEPTLLVLDDRTTMPNNTVLIDLDRDNRIGLHTRLELDANLE
ncbi:hypothetical protein CIG75_11195 [Tumebacillus algifaecis]|uniref:Phage tail protein n=1 Tax=Tumebacillus algifaecis TaxID=1214604 RepID=A0A223D1G3_9BACL|nr:phage tail protein [Tumebacillus algifaecis]ASS75488.1 hypothetical protein CIG75_11195 [Tumebacillus algifaecis]